MLESGSAQSGTYLFSRSNSFKAANLAYKMEQAEQASTGKSGSRFKALGKAWHAFKFRRVTVPELGANSESSNPIIQNAQNLVTNYTNRRICKRRLTQFDLPQDWKWSHGQAKKLSRQVVVRHWVSPHIEKSSIHTALSMKDSKSNDYSAWGPDYDPGEDSWQMSENKYKQRIGNLLNPARKYVGKLPPETAKSYAEEKGHYMSPNAQYKLGIVDQDLAKVEQLAQLMEDAKKPLTSAGKKVISKFKEIGLGAVFSPRSWKRVVHDGISEFKKLRNARHTSPPPDPSEKPGSPAKPYNFQKKNSKIIDRNNALSPDIPVDDHRRKNPWERRAQKVYLPCTGHSTTQSGEKQFVMFGLDLDAMRKTWTEVQDPTSKRHYYKTISKYQNCSGMSLSLLESGGSKQYATLKPKLYTNQPMINRYSHKLMERMDSLNEKTDFLFGKYKKIQPDSTVNSKDAPAAIRKSSKETKNKKFKRSLNALARLTDEFSKTKIPFEALTPFAIKYVDALEYAYSVSGGVDKEMKALEPALCVFANIRSRMMRALIQPAPSEGGD